VLAPREVSDAPDPDMTEPVVVITRPHVHVHDADLSRRERDLLVLTAEERRWGGGGDHAGGSHAALALPTGSTLTPATSCTLRPTGTS